MIKNLLHNIINKIKPIQVSGIGNKIENASKLGSKFLIRINGNDNTIMIGKNCLLNNTTVQISGNNNHIIIDDKVRFIGPCKIFMGGNASLHIKYNAGIRGVAFISENANIEIGELCMFSAGIIIRTNDGHKVIDPETHKVLNPSKDIVLGNHVWVAEDATILKGCHIGDNSIIGYGSVVTKSCEPGSIMAGNPARVVKENISWDY